MSSLVSSNLNNSFKKNKISSAAACALLALSSFGASSAFAVKGDAAPLTSPITYRVDQGDLRIEVTTGEVEGENAAEEAAVKIAEQIDEIKKNSPEAEVQLGYLEDSEESADRAATEAPKMSRARRMIKSVGDRIFGRSNPERSEAKGFRLARSADQPFRERFNHWFRTRTKTSWTLYRVGLITGVTLVAAAVTSQLPSEVMWESTGIVAAACIVTAVFAEPINTFQNHWRIYKQKIYTDFIQNHPDSWMAKYIAGPNETGQIVPRAFVSPVHSKLNFGSVEALFGGVIEVGKRAVLIANGIQPKEFNLGSFVINTGISTFTQGQWEEALGRYKIYLGSKGYREAEVKARYAFMSALGSFTSVIGYTFANNPGPHGVFTPVQLVGYGMLAALGLGGVGLDKYITKKEMELELETMSQLLNQTICNEGLKSGETAADLEAMRNAG